MKLSAKTKEFIKKIIIEYNRTACLRSCNFEEYLSEIEASNLVSVSVITPSEQVKVKITAKASNKEHCIGHLFNSLAQKDLQYKFSLGLIEDHNFNCYPYELKPYLDDFFFELIQNNTANIDFCSSFIKKEKLDKVIKNKEVGILLDDTIKKIENDLLSTHIFQFPFVTPGLKSDIQLSKNIAIKVLNSSSLDDNYEDKINYDKKPVYNAAIEIQFNTSSSLRFSERLAKEVSRLTSQIINIYAQIIYEGRDISSWPCSLPDNKGRGNPSLYSHIRAGESEGSPSAKDRNHNEFRNDGFWSEFLIRIEEGREEFDIIMKVPELRLIPSDHKRVGDLLFDALIWYGNAYSEVNPEMKSSRSIIAIGCLVNFEKNETGSLETFVSRVKALTALNQSWIGDVDKQCQDIYNARTSISQGLKVSNSLALSSTIFAMKTLHLSFERLDKFGFDKNSFKKTLPEYLDLVHEKHFGSGKLI